MVTPSTVFLVVELHHRVLGAGGAIADGIVCVVDVPIETVGRGEAIECIVAEHFIAGRVQTIGDGGDVAVGVVGEGQVLRRNGALGRQAVVEVKAACEGDACW